MVGSVKNEVVASVSREGSPENDLRAKSPPAGDLRGVGTRVVTDPEETVRTVRRSS